jgi:hypothetical protein
VSDGLTGIRRTRTSDATAGVRPLTEGDHAVPKIKIDDNLFDRVKKIAQIAGYSSTEEFIVHIIEKELGQMEKSDDEQAVLERLRGLGYIE